MQRKNNILRLSHRSGFAMILAMGVIVILASIMALSLSMTSQTTKQTTDLYLYEQAVLLSKSATEYALLRISQNNGCLPTINSFTLDGIYDINITLRYIGTAPSVCTDYISDLQTDEQNGSVMMDVTVSTDAATEPIRFFRRSIQKL
jgi:type II secretory pathway pseudopilin PulG